MEQHWMYLLSAVIQATAIGYAWVLAMYMYLLRGMEASDRSWKENAARLNFYTEAEFDDEVEKMRIGRVPVRQEVVRLDNIRSGLGVSRAWLNNVGSVLGVVTVLGTIVIVGGMVVLGYPIDNGWAVWIVVGIGMGMFGILGFVTLIVLNISYAEDLWLWFKINVLRKRTEGGEVVGEVFPLELGK